MKTTIEKLVKLSNSLVNHVSRGNSMGSFRSIDLIHSYNDLKQKALTENLWEEYCNISGFSSSHDAYDFFA